MRLTREQELDMRTAGPVSLAARTAAIIADLGDLSREEVASVKAKALATIAHNEASFARSNANGMRLAPEVLRRNNARHHLVVKCCEAVEGGAS